MTTVEAVGIIGVGRMGLPMAKNLLAENFEVIVSDPNPNARESAADAGATIADTAAEVGSEADAVLVTVPTGDDVLQICSGPEGLFGEMDEGVVIINSSTRPDLPELVQEEAPPNVGVVDAPMCRGEWAAQQGEILFLVGGEEADVSACEPIFSVCGEMTVLGELGAGQVGKTANNLLLWISLLGDYEVLRLAESLDVDPHKLREVLPKSSGDNWAIREDHLENIQLTWPEKDLSIALDLADETDSSVPMTGLASQLMKDLEVEDLQPYYFDS